MTLHRCLGLAVLALLLSAPLVARAEDAGPDASTEDSGAIDSGAADTGAPPTGNPPDTTSSSSGTPPITVDPGGKVPGSGQTETVPEDEGCRVSPASMASPSALVLALAALWFVRRKKR